MVARVSKVTVDGESQPGSPDTPGVAVDKSTSEPIAKQGGTGRGRKYGIRADADWKGNNGSQSPFVLEKLRIYENLHPDLLRVIKAMVIQEKPEDIRARLDEVHANYVTLKKSHPRTSDYICQRIAIMKDRDMETTFEHFQHQTERLRKLFPGELGNNIIPLIVVDNIDATEETMNRDAEAMFSLENAVCCLMP